MILKKYFFPDLFPDCGNPVYQAGLLNYYSVPITITITSYI